MNELHLIYFAQGVVQCPISNQLENFARLYVQFWIAGADLLQIFIFMFVYNACRYSFFELQHFNVFKSLIFRFLYGSLSKPMNRDHIVIRMITKS